jgi:hypothetical protein
MVGYTASGLLRNKAGELKFISVKTGSLGSLKGRVMAQVFRDRPGFDPGSSYVRFSTEFSSVSV